MAVRGIAAPSAGTIANSLVAAQAGIPVLMAPSGFFANNGVYVIGQAPSSAATVSFSATSGAGVTMTFSAATLLGTASDVGRVLTILDTTYKYATITAQSSTTVATVTLTGTLSGTGPFANASIWLTGMPYNLGNTVAFSSFFQTAFGNCYLYFPLNVISASTPAGVYFAQTLAAAGTVYTIFNNPLSSGPPTIPASPTAFVTTGTGAFAQTTGSNVTLLSIPVLANSIGPNGRLHVNCTTINNNSANNKSQTLSFGGVSIHFTANTTSNSYTTDHHIVNSGVASAQQTSSGSGIGALNIPTTLAVNTAADQNVTFLAQLANANDWMGYNYFVVEIFPKA